MTAWPSWLPGQESGPDLAGAPTVSVSCVLSLRYLGANGVDSSFVVSALKEALAAYVNGVGVAGGGVTSDALKAVALGVGGVASVTSIGCSAASIPAGTVTSPQLVQVLVTTLN